MIEFEKPNIECLEVNDVNNYAKFVCEFQLPKHIDNHMIKKTIRKN